MSTEQVQDNEAQQQDAGKEAKKFEKNFKTMVALINGDTLLKRTKVKKDDLSTAMEELAKEEKDSAIISIKEKIKALIKEKRDYDAFLAQKEKELQKAVDEKRKAFNKQMEAILQDVENVKSIEDAYYRSITEMGGMRSGAAPTLTPANPDQ